MAPLALLGIEIGMSFAVLAVLARHVVMPRLADVPRDRALRPLLWIHTLRHMPLALLAPGQIGRGVSYAAASAIAWGDFASGSLALVALASLYAGSVYAMASVQLFSVVSAIDIVVGLSLGLGTGAYDHALGVGWYVLALYVPLVCVSQILIAWLMFRSDPPRSLT